MAMSHVYAHRSQVAAAESGFSNVDISQVAWGMIYCRFNIDWISKFCCQNKDN